MARHKTKAISKQTMITIVGFVVLIGILGGASTWYFYTKSTQPAPIASSAVSLDTTPEYGACKIITSEIIKSSKNGDKIIAIAEGVRIGETAPNNTIAESCSFAFSTAKSNQNVVSVSVYPYTPSSEANPSEAVGTDWSEISSLTKTAYFGSTSGKDSLLHSVRVLPGAKNILFSLKQPGRVVSFTPQEAQDFLTEIVSKANVAIVSENVPSASSEGLPPEPDYSNSF